MFILTVKSPELCLTQDTTHTIHMYQPSKHFMLVGSSFKGKMRCCRGKKVENVAI